MSEPHAVAPADEEHDDSNGWIASAALKEAHTFLNAKQAAERAAEAAKRATDAAKLAYRGALRDRIAFLMGPHTTDARAVRERHIICEALAAFDAAEHGERCGCRWCRPETTP